MAQWTIYSKNNVAKAVVKELELHDEWMAECYLTITANSATPIDFAVGDYIDYRGERYTIEYSPNELKKASSGSYGEGFMYDNIKFVGLQNEVVQCDFNDIVLNDNNVHYTALPTFPFFCSSVDDLLDRIQANLEDLYPGEWIVIGRDTVRNSQRGTAVNRLAAFENAYRQWIDPSLTPCTDAYGKQDVAETVDNITCWEALAKVHDDFGLNFIVRGKVIIVGTAGVNTTTTFRYGKGNGLYEIERVGDSEQKIVTRLRAYGTEENLPERYYATLNMQVFANVVSLEKYSTSGCSFILNLDFDNKYFNKQSVSFPTTGNTPNYIVELLANNVQVRGYVTRETQGSRCYVYCEYVSGSTDDRDEPDATKMAAFVNALSVGNKVYFADNVNKDTFNAANQEYATQNLPNNMAVSKLMLCGFPTQSLHDWVEAHKNTTGYEWLLQAVNEGFTFSTDRHRPYIDSPNIAEYGIRPASIFFDGSDEKANIHPTIEGMTYNGIAIDEIYAAEQVSDNGVYPAGEEVDNITLTLPVLGFELDKYWNEEASIEMKSGMCGARSFKIAEKPTKDSNGRWLCKVQRVHDESLDLWFPYCDFQIHGSSESNSGGDKFVLVGISMPPTYIDAAAERLLRSSIEALKKNHAPRNTYQPHIDELWMQRQHDNAIANGGVSLHDTLKAGDTFSFADTDLGINASIIIDVLTIKENGNNGIPTYEITLRDEKEVGAVKKLTDKINSVFSEAINGGIGGGLSARQVQSLVNALGDSKYLSKVSDDTAEGNVTFEKDVKVEGTTHTNDIRTDNYTGDGMFDTGGIFQYLSGKVKIVADQIVCRGKFLINQIEERIWSHAGGNLMLSPSSSTIFYVEYLDSDGEALGYTYINSPWLLNKVPLLAGIIAWSRRKKILRSLTDEERAQVVKFRCYELSDDGTMETRNWWQLDDFAFCQTLNRVRNKVASSGSYSGTLTNVVYCRKVVGIGSSTIDIMNDGKIYDYVDLSLTDCDPIYNDWPTAGDVIVQRGNATNTQRQGFTTIEVDGDRRGVKVYDNVNGYSLENKLKAFLGYDTTFNDGGGARAFLQVLGDAFIGSTNKYIRFNSHTGELEIKAKISISSTFGDADVNTYIDGLIHDVTDDIQNQVDKKAETFHQATNPATEWTTDAIRAEHVGDMWYCTADISGTSYKQDTTWRYSSSYQWEAQPIPKAVFDTIDGKAQLFISKPQTAQADGYCYRKNDMWVLESGYTLGGVSYKKGTIVFATTDSATWSASHWVKKDMYTDDSAFLGWKADGYARDITGLTNSISDAQTAADNAQSSANSANTRLTNWADNGLISPTEKTGLKDQKADIQAEYTQIIADANRYSVGTTAYTTAYNSAITAFNKYTASTPENITVESDYSNISAYYTARQVILNAIAAAAKQYANDCAQTVSNAHEYLRNALKAKTDIDGGLIMTTFIGLRKYNGGDASDPASYTTYGGLNGVYVNDSTPAAWFGGPMVDRLISNITNEYDYDSDNKANSMIRMDGSGYFSRGKFNFKANGDAFIGGFVINQDSIGKSTWEQGDGGTTYIEKNGYIYVRNDDENRDCGLVVYGGANIQGNGKDVMISSIGDITKKVTIEGQNVNINTYSWSNATTNIGNPVGFLNINAPTTINRNVVNNANETVNGVFEAASTFILSGSTTLIINTSTSAKTVALPAYPKQGQVVFARGTSGTLTLTHLRIRKTDDSTVTSIGGDRRPRILVYADNYWNEFYCG